MNEAYRLARKDSPQTSKDAAEKIAPKLPKLRELVLSIIKEAGEEGITVREMTDARPQFPYSSLAVRPQELLKRSLVFYKGDTRNGARVIRAIEYKEDEEAETVEQLELEL